jgi:hypothetical protein
MTVPDVELPAPMSWMPVKEIPPDQLHVPAGTWTVSPGLADATADATLACEQEAALRVAARAGLTDAKTKRLTSHFMTALRRLTCVARRMSSTIVPFTAEKLYRIVEAGSVL